MENRAKIIGNRIRLLRDHLGLTQAEFANTLERTQQYVSKCEQGKQLATSEILLDICEKFDVDLGYFDPNQKGLETLLKKPVAAT